MTLDANGPDDYPAEGGGHALQIASAHVQAQLAAIAGLYGKLMFLSALNVAGISALVGIVASAEPSMWLSGLGLAASSACALLGLGNLWAEGVDQFPTPEEAARAAREHQHGDDMLAWQLMRVLDEAAQQANEVLDRKLRVVRALLIGTPISLGVVVATALTAAL